jgi:hypothetical protein
VRISGAALAVSVPTRMEPTAMLNPLGIAMRAMPMEGDNDEQRFDYLPSGAFRRALAAVDDTAGAGGESEAAPAEPPSCVMTL